MARRTPRGAVPRRGSRRSAPAPDPTPRSAASAPEKGRTGRPPAPPMLYLQRHLGAAATALGRFLRAPLQSGLTTAVIAVALALPAAFFVLLDNAERVAGAWEGGTPEISLFMEREAEGLEERARELGRRDGVAGVRVIHPDEALAELRGVTDLDQALSLLDDNPLPPVLVATVAAELPPDAVRELAAALAETDGVERMRLDQEWVERLHALLELVERTVWFVAVLLAVAVVLVVGNTVRMTVEHRRAEIEIVKLIGGSNGFVRRPFLYEGAWFGVLGGAVAWLLTESGRWLLAEPASTLALLHDSPFRLEGPGLAGGALLLAAGGALGLIGAWVCVARQLSAIEPR